MNTEKLKMLVCKKVKHDGEIYVFDEIGSTNTALKTIAEKNTKEGTVVIALKQNSGRGTQGRSFFSPEGGLYLSLLVRPKFSVQKAQILTVIAGVAVVGAIRKVLKIKCGIKWVNDIMLNGKKVGGILTEAGLDSGLNSLKYAVIGIGLNLSKPKCGFPKEIENIAGYLSEEKITETVYAKILAEIINRTFRLCSNLNKSRFIKTYQRYSVLKKEEIIYKKNGEKHICRVVGIDRNARLVIEENNKKSKLNAGEVTLYRT